MSIYASSVGLLCFGFAKRNPRTTRNTAPHVAEGHITSVNATKTRSDHAVAATIQRRRAPLDARRFAALMPTPSEQELALQRTLVTRDAVIAFMMGGHPRLGARSPLRRIPVVLLRHAASLVWHQKFDATFDDPNGPHRMGADRKEIGWSIETHQQGFVAVEVARPITLRHAVARVRLEYTCVDDEACFRAGGAELRLLEVHDVDHGYVVPRTYATINGRHVPALDDCWAVLRPIAVDLEVDALRGSVAFAVDDVEVGSVPIAVDANHGVRVSAEDRSEGLPLEGETEWRANVSTRAPRRSGRKGPLFCGSATCFCRFEVGGG